MAEKHPCSLPQIKQQLEYTADHRIIAHKNPSIKDSRIHTLSVHEDTSFDEL